MAYAFDAVVIGAGAVGLACGRRLAGVGLRTLIVERERSYGTGVSSRSSEVIHAGIYYRPGSLKAKLCRRGNIGLYEYCERRRVPYRRTGKWIVATSAAQLPKLHELQDRARRNGVDDVSIRPGDYARALEPELRCEAILDSPFTGILDSHALMSALAADVEDAGGQIAFRACVSRIAVGDGEISVTIGEAEATRVSCSYLVNSAGLDAPLLARKINGLDSGTVPTPCYAKGNYFSLRGKSPFQRLIYPVPDHGGLGVHLTLDLAGRARFGPDVEWVSAPDYAVNESRAEPFVEAIHTYWAGCRRDRLTPAYAGIRPKLGTPEQFADDFVIQDASEHGIPGLVNLFGIESPGLTSCLAIADEVAERLQV